MDSAAGYSLGSVKLSVTSRRRCKVPVRSRGQAANASRVIAELNVIVAVVAASDGLKRLGRGMP